MTNVCVPDRFIWEESIEGPAQREGGRPGSVLLSQGTLHACPQTALQDRARLLAAPARCSYLCARLRLLTSSVWSRVLFYRRWGPDSRGCPPCSVFVCCDRSISLQISKRRTKVRAGVGLCWVLAAARRCWEVCAASRIPPDPSGEYTEGNIQSSAHPSRAGAAQELFGAVQQSCDFFFKCIYFFLKCTPDLAAITPLPKQPLLWAGDPGPLCTASQRPPRQPATDGSVSSSDLMS